jgi:hypothetical protein
MMTFLRAQRHYEPRLNEANELTSFISEIQVAFSKGAPLLASSMSQKADGKWSGLIPIPEKHRGRSKRTVKDTGATLSKKARNNKNVPPWNRVIVQEQVLQDQNGCWNSEPIAGSFQPAPSLGNTKGKKRKAEDIDFILRGRSTSPDSRSNAAPSIPQSKMRKTLAPRTRRKSLHIKYYQSVQDAFPAPYGRPPAWANRRQALCETLPYYRAYMSGAYMHGGCVRAFMCDKEVGPRDKFDDEIVIARV